MKKATLVGLISSSVLAITLISCGSDKKSDKRDT